VKAKDATVSLYVAITSVLAAILAIVGAALLLLAALTSRLAMWIQAPPKATKTPERKSIITPAKAEEMRLRLSTGLRGLGFPTRDVTRFVDSLGGRIESEQLEDLLREGLVALSNARLS
jgi:hypothetical protein